DYINISSEMVLSKDIIINVRVATNEGWLSVEWDPSVRCKGYRSSSVDRQKLAHLWTIFENQTDFKVASLVELVAPPVTFRYSNLGVLHCYTYSKTHRLAECTFNIDEMLDEEVIEKACLKFLLHPVCEYIWILCKKFMSYYSEDSSRRSSRVASTEEMTGVEIIPWPVARPKNINPRFEIFCMNVCVADSSFRMGDMHGIVSLVDTDGLLSDGRLPLNISENGHAAYFYREWYDSIDIRETFFTTDDKCVQMCLGQQPIDLSEMWNEPLNYMRGTLRYDSNNGCISMDYIALRDVVDTTMKLSLESPDDPLPKPCVFGCILASYEEMLDNLDDLREGCYKDIIFKAGEDGRELKVGPLSLQKSVLAVPANGTLVLEARFFDKSGNVILNEKHTSHAQTQDSSEWRMHLRNCFLKLIVEWSQGVDKYFVLAIDDSISGGADVPLDG
ncbi:hypothetical protein Tco_0601827, partial [Tanacetum coccineum]